ncbi:response regulator [Pseudonocardia hydrocarbonoxydans]|uniref:Transcriptional regulatory protein n=1 Tax=Pseudonocardia hydrocarbonoxydans TaxID=76726 RepID=A0A4Y3WIU1_9PSEU|nr:response regulator [Pseudonocardia hydrocarbonoxydans]GEC18847.1 transcriptional regulatory protein [Pseudonocardia hydrocarbonoxydans]
MIRTLVVDDDPVALAAHAAYVERVRGFAVVGRAPAGAEALRLLATTAVDLVLLDVHLPDMSGLDVLRRMRAAGHTCDVIMVTRARDLEVVRAAVAFGATQYLMKPFPAGVVRAKLEGYLAYRQNDPGPLVAQSDVDGMLDALRAPTVDSGLPKGISRESLDQVCGVLAPDAGRTAVEVADLVGVSRVTARRYLEHLADTGLTERALRYGTTGRPQVEYRWRPRGST